LYLKTPGIVSTFTIKNIKIKNQSIMNFPENLKYTREHEWIRVEGNEGIIGITGFAQKELGDIVFIDIYTEGETLTAGEKFGAVEAVKTVSDLFMPVGGTVLSINAGLEIAPETVNKDPYGDGWMIRIQPTSLADLDGLMSAAEYEAFTNE
jgi:glycine cleavage system H protein